MVHLPHENSKTIQIRFGSVLNFTSKKLRSSKKHKKSAISLPHYLSTSTTSLNIDILQKTPTDNNQLSPKNDKLAFMYVERSAPFNWAL